MQVITYEYEKIKRVAEIIGRMSFCGFDAARSIVEIGDILDSGIPGEISDTKKEEENKNGMAEKEV